MKNGKRLSFPGNHRDLRIGLVMERDEDGDIRQMLRIWAIE